MPEITVWPVSISAEARRSLLEKFWSETPPSLFASTEAERFLAFLEGRGSAIPQEILSAERERLRVAKGG